VEVTADALNLGFVLGNKVMVGTVNAGREHYEVAARDLVMTESQYPGWLSRLRTHPVKGLDNYEQPFSYCMPLLFRYERLSKLRCGYQHHRAACASDGTGVHMLPYCPPAAEVGGTMLGPGESVSGW